MKKMYFDRGCGYWVGPVSQEEINQIEAEPGNISVGEIRDYDQGELDRLNEDLTD